jgi:hypothetical protein
MQLPFNAIRLEDGSNEVLSVRAFLALPLHRRVRVILHRQVQFLSDQTVVDTSDALKALRDAEASGAIYALVPDY